jgi:hypothetical protein
MAELLKIALQKLTEREGISFDQLLVDAASEKIAAMETEKFFRTHRESANKTEFLRILNRQGGEPPRPEDSLE